jgi:hydrogenase-4 component E
MNSLVEALLTFTILANLVLAGTSRLAVCIRLLGAQGFALGLMPLLLPETSFERSVGLAFLSSLLKGLVFPWLLFRAMRSADVRHEVEPYVGYSLSILLGVATLGLSLWLAPRLSTPLTDLPHEQKLVLPTALFTVTTGLFLIVSRKTALMQVVGYLALENGIYLFGLALARDEPAVVEMGVLLDVFVAVFVMGITIFHISREFDHIDVDQMTKLKD